MENVIEVKNLVKKYDGFCLKNISFSLKKGTITGFIGKNGAGKSTTLKAIMGLIQINSGEIKLGAKKIKNSYPIGYLGMEKSIYPDESLEKIAKFVSNAWKDRWNEKEFQKYMTEVFGLDPKRKMKELSTGMVIKFLLAIELAKNPEILLLDEPTSGLDPVIREEILSILRRLVNQKGITVLFSTHITEDVMKIADHVIYINAGQIVFNGSKSELSRRFVKIEKNNLHGLPAEIKTKVLENAILNREYYIWDNEAAGIKEIKVKSADLDEALIILGGN